MIESDPLFKTLFLQNAPPHKRDGRGIWDEIGLAGSAALRNDLQEHVVSINCPSATVGCRGAGPDFVADVAELGKDWKQTRRNETNWPL
ncbi:uncharacterized protein UV8b_02550 [Ustilaginoidea virens]|uniref:Uncharacterized protein n=1 Tax=Ustilaginoidea virens TaxID=1159556 RepID=A0A8E5HMX5_USTVR|nr:uncharacterized protein UV8b_02550 [Ustilaginoidea virens]QUC18309.1 hypothetical protein UV8b_02550 [Ustilaginoidea virens]